MKVLIVGDSFAADWTAKYSDQKGWPNYLSEQYSVTNLAQAGCSEYKIRKQLDSVNLNEFSHCIVSHTSPNRIPVEHNPLHTNDILHHSCDFIYADICESKNSSVQSIKEYYEKHFYQEYYDYVHSLIINDIDKLIKQSSVNTLHITFFDIQHPLINKNYFNIFQAFPGKINHLSDSGNKRIFEDICQWINQ